LVAERKAIGISEIASDPKEVSPGILEADAPPEYTTEMEPVGWDREPAIHEASP
jgi:hypothetical protein